MTTFLIAFILLIAGYVLYGMWVEKKFGADPQRKTPCFTCQDGVDYIPMPTWKVFLIQFLNIAGTGPIFGAIQGILFGPSAYLWIVLGCIFGGAVHDYLSGMISIRMKGASLPEIVGSQMGKPVKLINLFLSMVLMILVGAVFVTTPAGLLTNLTQGWGDKATISLIWTALIFLYYLLATLLPVDKLIGKIYPVFGVALLIMAVGVMYGIIAFDGQLPEIMDAFTNHHPSENSLPIFPGLCITIACGAVSGFHATQSPMMARCLKNEKLGRPVFYGAMITEGIVALIWAAAAIKFADSLSTEGVSPYEKLLAAMTDPETGKMNPAIIVNQICHSWLGTVGAVLAILGVVAAPITSGDTALRSARLILADFLKIKQDKIAKRLMLALPVFVLSFILINIDFQILWRYFAWLNQTLAVFTLWAITIYLARRKGWTFIIGIVPAVWMTAVCTTYIFIAPEGFSLSPIIGDSVGIAVALIALTGFALKRNKLIQSTEYEKN